MQRSKSEALVARDRRVISRATHIPYYPLAVDRTENAAVYDLDGNRYIDWLSSASSLNTGGNNPRIAAAVEAQFAKSPHYTAAYAYNEPMVQLAERLVALAPGRFPKKAAIGLCGSDANDAAIKFSRAFTKRHGVISFAGAYHGSSYGALSLAAITNKLKRGLGPVLGDVYHFPYADCYRCPYGLDCASCKAQCLGPLEEAFSMWLPPDEVACCVVEPIQGDGGIRVPAAAFMQRLYALCREHGILFICEEVQTGLGRTGRMFGIEHFGVEPDALILGKSLGAGLPLGALVGRADMLDVLPPPAHVFTHSGNALCCAAALAALDILESPGFLEEVRRKGERMRARFAQMQARYPLIGDIRGPGLCIGVDLVEDRADKTRAERAASRICCAAYEKGLLLMHLAGNVLRIQPPLTIEDADIDAGFDILESVFADEAAGRIPDSITAFCKGW